MKLIFNKPTVILLSILLIFLCFSFSSQSTELMPTNTFYKDFCPRIFLKNTKQSIKLRKALLVITTAAEKLNQPHLNGEILQSLLVAAFGGKSPGVNAITNLGCILNQMEPTQKQTQTNSKDFREILPNKN